MNDNPEHAGGSPIPYISFFAIFLAIGWLLERFVPFLRPTAPLIASLCAAATAVSLYYLERQAISDEIVSLANAADPAQIGRLADMLWVPNASSRKTRCALAGALTRLLPQLKPEDSDRLSSEQWANLDRVLLHGMLLDADFVLAVLVAETRLGRTAALAYVRRLAEADAALASEKRVRAAAREYLPLLQAFAEQARNEDTLLRPTQAPGPASKELLRPVGEAPDTGPEQLLRASEE